MGLNPLNLTFESNLFLESLIVSLCLKYLVHSSKWRVEVGVYKVVFFPFPEEIVYIFLLYFGILISWSSICILFIVFYPLILLNFWFANIFLPLSQREYHCVLDMDFIFLLCLDLFCPIRSYQE